VQLRSLSNVDKAVKAAGQVLEQSDVDVARVLVVHASDVIRAGLCAVLAREPDIEMTGSVGSAEEALLLIEREPVDVVLLDLSLPGLRGSAACEEIARRFTDAALLVLAPCVEDTVIHACLRAGARGYLPRTATGADIVSAVRSAARGEPALSPAVVDRLVDWARRTARPPIDEGTLAPSEILTLSLVAQGLKNREIARRLGVSEASVKLYLRSAMRKLGVRERSSAVAAGMRRGVI
jgi:DNA-binding NarL/FixJ family response regulator